MNGQMVRYGEVIPYQEILNNTPIGNELLRTVAVYISNHYLSFIK